MTSWLWFYFFKLLFHDICMQYNLIYDCCQYLWLELAHSPPPLQWVIWALPYQQKIWICCIVLSHFNYPYSNDCCSSVHIVVSIMCILYTVNTDEQVLTTRFIYTSFRLPREQWMYFRLGEVSWVIHYGGGWMIFHY